MASEEYVPVAGDDWYQRRRDDAEGKFFRAIADQGPRKGEGGGTRQGIYLFTADGKLLAYKNAQDPAVMRDVLKTGLERWSKLPEESRKPGAVQIDEPGKPDVRYVRTPPANGLILEVHTRCLDKNKIGEFGHAECKVSNEAALDHLWLTEAEWKSLLPRKPLKGDSVDVPAKIAERIARFHLVDNTRGEPPHWTKEQLRRCQLTLTVHEVGDIVELRLTGNVLAAVSMPAEKSERGYEAELRGILIYDAKQSAIKRFDIVALGEHWGEGVYTKGARPGRTPLGVAFRRIGGDQPADRVPPQAARDQADYFGR